MRFLKNVFFLMVFLIWFNVLLAFMGLFMLSYINLPINRDCFSERNVAGVIGMVAGVLYVGQNPNVRIFAKDFFEVMAKNFGDVSSPLLCLSVIGLGKFLDIKVGEPLAGVGLVSSVIGGIAKVIFNYPDPEGLLTAGTAALGMYIFRVV